MLTPTHDDAGEPPAEVMMPGTPAGHSGTPDAIANAAVDLAIDDGALCTEP